MRLTTLDNRGKQEAALLAPHGWVAMSDIQQQFQTPWPVQAWDLITSGAWESLLIWYREKGRRDLASLPAIPESQAVKRLLYSHPRKIWGIGMNYRPPGESPAPPAPGEYPVSFMKPDTTLIGPRESVQLPTESNKVTAEAELAIIIGKTCRNIIEEEAPFHVAGLTGSLDMTAADIHEQNPRYLTRAKSFDTFLSIGPEIITLDELPAIGELEVSTWLNGVERHSNKVAWMRFQPWWVVAFHSRFMTLNPGDIILTGTPGAVVIRNGDLAECRISGFPSLYNPVT